MYSNAGGLDVIVRGLGIGRTDHDLLAITQVLFDGLYEYQTRSKANIGT